MAGPTDTQKITTCLWFDGQAEAAADFYLSILPGGRITHTLTSAVDWPGGKAGDVVLVSFELAGQSYQALNGGPSVEFSEAVSLSITCEDQDEVDRLWDALTADGGAPIMCGWLKDKFGLRWQIVPRAFHEMMEQGDSDQQTRVMAAMMQMVKLDIAELQQAFESPN